MEFKLFIFDHNEALIDILDSQGEITFISAIHNEHDHFFTVKFMGGTPPTISEGNYVGFYNYDQEFQLFEIKRINAVHDSRGLYTEVFCEHVIYELLNEIVTAGTLTNATAVLAVQEALKGTRWVCQSAGNFGVRTVEYYFENAMRCLQKVKELWTVNFKYRITLSENTISGRYLDLVLPLTAVSSKRFEWNKDLVEVEREVDCRGVVTALYGRGKPYKVKAVANEPGHSERIDFGSAVWQTPANPVNKPINQLWVGDPAALQLWGYGGKDHKRHRFGVVVFDQISDPKELLDATWEQLQHRNKPAVFYSMKAIDFEKYTGYQHEKIRLGDTVTVIDDGFTPKIQLTAKVTKVVRDYMNPMETKVSIGNIVPDLSSILSEIEKENERLKDKEGVYDDVSNILTPGGGIDTSRLEGSINVLANQLIASGSYATATPIDGKGFLLENTNVNSPDFGALYLGPGFMAIANKKSNNKWQWRTFGTGKGFIADEVITGTLDAALIRSGRLQSANGQSWIDMQNGQFSFGNGNLSLLSNGEVKVKGQLVSEKNNKRVYINTDEFGFPLIGFQSGSEGIGYIYAPGLNEMKMDVYGKLTLQVENEIHFNAGGIKCPNGSMALTTVVTVGTTKLYFSGGLLYKVA